MKYALFGDSHAQVVFPILERKLNEQGHDVVISKPVAGWTLKKHLENDFESLLMDSDADVLLLSLGGNNADLSPSYGDTVNKALSIAKRAGIKTIYWVSPASSTRSDVQTRHEWTSNWLKTNLPKKVRFIDIRSITKDGHRSDGVHFTNQKYAEWAELVSDHLLTKNAITQIPTWTWWASGSMIVLSLIAVGLKRWKN